MEPNSELHYPANVHQVERQIARNKAAFKRMIRRFLIALAIVVVLYVGLIVYVLNS